MDMFSSSEARARFGELLDRVARGEEIVITRHDKAVARIRPEGNTMRKPVADLVVALAFGAAVLLGAGASHAWDETPPLRVQYLAFPIEWQGNSVMLGASLVSRTTSNTMFRRQSSNSSPFNPLIQMTWPHTITSPFSIAA